MRNSYRALAILAALAVVAAALDTPYLQVYAVNHIFTSMQFTNSQSTIRAGELVRLIVAAIWQTFWLLVTVTLTLASVAAALSKRKRWFAALLLTGLVAVYWPYILDGFIAAFMPPLYPVSWFSFWGYWLPAIMPVIASLLALIFALQEGRRAQGARQSAPEVA